MELILPARPPFSLPAVIRSHGWVRLAPFQYEDHSNEFSYVARLETGRVVELIVQEASGGVSVRVENALGDKDRTELSRIVNWMLGLDQDFSAFYTLVQREPRLAHAARQARGRVLRCPTLFEDIVKTILTTNTIWAGTIRMTETLVSLYGDPLADEPSRHAFPTAERLASLDEQTLRATARLGYRAPYILGLAQRVASGELDLEKLKTAEIPTEQLRKELMKIKGVGGYAAANLLMILGRYDFIPVDSWALKMVSQEWHDGAPVSPAEVEAAFERWGEWKGLAYWFWDWSHKD